MGLTRRAALGAGLFGALWTFPALGEDAASDGGFRVFEAAPTDKAKGLAYGGATPGPELRVKKGEALVLRFVNRLEEPTTLGFPGLRLGNAYAGVGGLTEPPVAPGASRDLRIAPPDAGFNLYLPHNGTTDAKQQSRGLFGPIVVEEPAALDVDLDAIVVFSEWRPSPEGAIIDDSADPAIASGAVGVSAATFANAAPAPLTLTTRPGARMRLRLANAATARLMAIGAEGAKPLVIAIDGQPCEPFSPLRNQFPLPPGARIELILDAAAEVRGQVRLVLLRANEAEADRPLVIAQSEGEPIAPRQPSRGLAANPLLPVEIALETAQRFELAFTGGGGQPFRVNGVQTAAWTPKPLFSLARGAACSLTLTNKTAVVQVLRLHGHVARLLHGLDDGWEPYWRDIIVVAPEKTSHIAFVADNPGKWPIASAIPEHRAAGAAAWFEVR